MRFLLILLSSFCWAQNVYAQVSSSWYVDPNLLLSGDPFCLVGSQVSLDLVDGYLNIVGAVQNQTCSDRNLNGTLRNGPTAQLYIGGQIQQTAFQFQYGVIHYRAALPSVSGSWPVIWMLGYPAQPVTPFTFDGVGGYVWPTAPSNEIDLSERLGGHGDNITIHNGAATHTCGWNSGDLTPTFHDYVIVWAANSLTKYADGSLVCTLTSDVPANAMFLYISLFVGGASGTVNPASFPQTMNVDFIRVCPPGTGTASCTASAATLFDDEFNAAYGSTGAGAGFSGKGGF